MRRQKETAGLGRDEGGERAWGAPVFEGMAATSEQPRGKPAGREELEMPGGEFEIGDEEELGGDDFPGDDLLGGEFDGESGEDPFDDEAAANLETGIELAGDEAYGAPDEGAEREVDVGALDEGLMFGDAPEGVLGGEDEADEGIDADLAEGITADEEAQEWTDAGEEGTDDSGDEAVDEDALPELDADEEGEFESDDLEREMLFASDSSVPAWAPEDELWTLMREGCDALPFACTALSYGEGRLVFAAGGRIGEWACEGGEWRWLEGWTAGMDVVGVAATSAGVWAVRGEALWWLPRSGHPGDEAREIRRGVVNAAVSEGILFGLERTPEGAWLVEIDLQGVQSRHALAGDALRAMERGHVFCVAAQGRCVALAGGSVCLLSRDFGKSFRVYSLPSVLALGFSGDAVDSPLLALVAHPFENKAVLVSVDAQEKPVCVAELFGPAPETRAHAADEDEDDKWEDDESAEPEEGGEASAWTEAGLAWDAGRGRVWIAGPAGFYELAPPANTL